MPAATFRATTPGRLTPAEVEDALRWFARSAGGVGPHTSLWELAEVMAPGRAADGLDLNPFLDDLESRNSVRFDRARLFDGLTADSTVADLCRRIADGPEPAPIRPPTLTGSHTAYESENPPAPRIGKAPADPAETPWAGHERRVLRARVAAVAVPAAVAGGMIWACGLGTAGRVIAGGGAVLAAAAGQALIGVYDKERRETWDLELLRPKSAGRPW
jgi:hypothetical protein